MHESSSVASCYQARPAGYSAALRETHTLLIRSKNVVPRLRSGSLSLMDSKGFDIILACAKITLHRLRGLPVASISGTIGTLYPFHKAEDDQAASGGSLFGIYLMRASIAGIPELLYGSARCDGSQRMDREMADRVAPEPARACHARRAQLCRDVELVRVSTGGHTRPRETADLLWPLAAIEERRREL